MMRKVGLILIASAVILSQAVACGETVSESTIGDQKAVEVTVYNSNLGLIKDRRGIALPVGEGELRFMDVASYIMPVTVHVKSVNMPEEFAVLEQNYEYDLLNRSKLLDKYVGRKLSIITWNMYQDRKDVSEVTLLSNNDGQIYDINGTIYIGHPGYLALPELPDDLIAKPTLTWLYQNIAEEAHDVEVSYLTNNIDWNADYVMLLDNADRSSDISGWVTIDNRSGAAYNNASLKLVAGDIHRETDKEYMMAEQTIRTRAAAAPSFEEQAFFEYHIYDLQRPTTIKDNQTKQISLLEAAGVAVDKELIVRGQQWYYRSHYGGRNTKQDVGVYINFRNSQENNMGMPLPAGVMRLYKKDHEGALQFIGEDRIDHTPKDEELTLKIGEAFDVVAERVQTDYKAVTTRLHETEWEITLRNHKEEAVTVGIEEPLYGSWRVVSKTHDYEKIDAFTIRFDVGVPADGEVKVKYRVRVGI